MGVVGPSVHGLQFMTSVTKESVSGSVWKVAPQRVIVPYAKAFSLTRRHLSSARHVKPGVNPRGPPRKAKYVPMTDSAPVP